jgi:hypothetical protein
MFCCEKIKMTESLSRGHDLAAHNYEVCDVNHPLRYNTCWKYKSKLEEMAVELITTKKIIELLQEELNTYKDLTPPSTSQKVSNVYVNNNLTNKWEIVNDTSRKSSRIIRDQQPIPVIAITNRYNALHNLEN